MSFRTECNHCALKACAKAALAMKPKRTIMLRPNPTAEFPEGMDVFTVLEDGSDRVWAMWIASTPGRCVCHE